jgi:hypothetical protein
MIDAIVLELYGIPYVLGTFSNQKDAEAALRDCRKNMTPIDEPVWFYLRDHETLARL